MPAVVVLTMTVLVKFQVSGEVNTVRLIFVHHPWCWMVGVGKPHIISGSTYHQFYCDGALREVLSYKPKHLLDCPASLSASTWTWTTQVHSWRRVLNSTTEITKTFYLCQWTPHFLPPIQGRFVYPTFGAQNPTARRRWSKFMRKGHLPHSLQIWPIIKDPRLEIGSTWKNRIN